MAVDLYDRRFIFFTGKGGVGKTTVASAFALSCARDGEKTLLIEINVKDKVSSMFGSNRVGPEIMEIEDNLYAVNSTPDAALEEYALMMLKVRIVYKAVFENRIVKSFLRAIPGLNELVMLGKAYYHAVEKENDDSYVWDKVIVDAPATGHGIFFLHIPTVITSVLGSGHMYDEAKKIESVLHDPDFSALNIVTLPEEMPVNESKMLHREAVDKLQIPLGHIIVNGVYPDLFDDRETAVIEDAHDDDIDSEIARGLIDAARFRATRSKIQDHYLEVVREEIPMSGLRLPFYFTDRLDFQNILSMAKSLKAQISGARSDDAG